MISVIRVVLNFIKGKNNKLVTRKRFHVTCEPIFAMKSVNKLLRRGKLLIVALCCSSLTIVIFQVAEATSLSLSKLYSTTFLNICVAS